MHLHRRGLGSNNVKNYSVQALLAASLGVRKKNCTDHTLQTSLLFVIIIIFCHYRHYYGIYYHDHQHHPNTCPVIVEVCQELHKLFFVSHKDVMYWCCLIWVGNKYLQ